MTKQVIVTGLKETQASLSQEIAEVRIQLPKVLDNVGRKTKGVAKQACPRDTGALQDSIHNKLTEKGPETFKEEIIAGDPKFIRGTGKYKRDSLGREVFKIDPTDTYASTVDEIGSPLGRGKGFMSQHAFEYAKGKAVKDITTMVRRIKT